MDGAAIALRRRDVRVMGLVGFAHFFSHFFQLALPPLFPFIYADAGFNYTQLGVVMTLFYVASAGAMTFAGVLVDRIGARNTLLAGLVLEAAAIGLCGITSNYGVLCLLGVLGGIGNSVFHPADYSILSNTISEQRMARAYSVHNFTGFLGYAAAPTTMVALATTVGWRTAAIVASLLVIPMVVAVALKGNDFRDLADVRRATGATGPQPTMLQLVAQPAVLLCFVFFALLAGATIGLQSFTGAALNEAMQTPLVIGNAALTVYLLSAPVGVLVGGAITDRYKRPDLVAVFGYGIAAVLLVLLALVRPPDWMLWPWLAVGGFCVGLVFPARDIMVRAITPPGSSGKVFGFVYAGMDVGSAVSPVFLGWLMDNGEPRLVFVSIAVLTVLGLACLLASRRYETRARVAPAE